MMIALIGMACVMSIMPGPSTAAILDLTWTNGRKTGLATALGGSLGVAIYALLALLIGTFLSGEGLWVSMLEGAGAIYLAALGIMAFIEAFKLKRENSQEMGLIQNYRAFTIGLISTLLSPKTALFYLVILSQYDFQAMTMVAGIATAGVIHMFFRLAWYGTWIHLIEPMRRALNFTWMQRGIKLVTGTLMMGLSLLAIL